MIIQGFSNIASTYGVTNKLAVERQTSPATAANYADKVTLSTEGKTLAADESKPIFTQQRTYAQERLLQAASSDRASAEKIGCVALADHHKLGHAIQINSKQVLIDAEDERNAVSEGNHSGLYPMVCSVRAQLPEPRGNDVGARDCRGPLDGQSLGDSFSAGAGKYLSTTEAAGGWQLANGRDVYQSSRTVEVSLSGG